MAVDDRPDRPASDPQAQASDERFTPPAQTEKLREQGRAMNPERWADSEEADAQQARLAREGAPERAGRGTLGRENLSPTEERALRDQDERTADQARRGPYSPSDPSRRDS